MRFTDFFLIAFSSQSQKVVVCIVCIDQTKTQCVAFHFRRAEDDNSYQQIYQGPYEPLTGQQALLVDHTDLLTCFLGIVPLLLELVEQVSLHQSLFV